MVSNSTYHHTDHILLSQTGKHRHFSGTNFMTDNMGEMEEVIPGNMELWNYVILYQLKLIKMRTDLANLNNYAVPFLSRAAVNLFYILRKSYILIKSSDMVT